MAKISDNYLSGHQLHEDKIKPMDKRIKAFLDTVSKSEGADYDSMFGDRPGHPNKITDFSKHPKIYYPYTNKAGETIKTSAAGRYQFIFSTWDSLQKRLHLPDFSPASQDLAAEQLLKDCGAYNFLIAGDLKHAVEKARTQWASLPDSGVSQPTHSYAVIEQWYRDALA